MNSIRIAFCVTLRTETLAEFILVFHLYYGICKMFLICSDIRIMETLFIYEFIDLYANIYYIVSRKLYLQYFEDKYDK